jgi:hypothetical protein
MPKKSVPLSEVPDADLIARIEQNIPTLVRHLGNATSQTTMFHVYTQLQQQAVPSQAPLTSLGEIGDQVRDAGSILTRITADYMELHRRMVHATKPKKKSV